MVMVVVVVVVLEGVCTKRPAMVGWGLTIDFFQNGRGYKNARVTT
jgi:hypothetical protein